MPLLVIVIAVIVIILVVLLRMKKFSRNKAHSTNKTYEDMTMANIYENVGIQNMNDSTEKDHFKR